MERAIDIINFICIAYLLLFIFMLGKQAGKKQQYLPAIFFCISVIGYILIEWPPIKNSWLIFLFLVFTFALPFNFWLFSKSIFDDAFKLRKWMFGAMAGAILVSYLLLLWRLQKWFGAGPEQYTFSIVCNQGITLFFLVLAILEAVKNRADDLILARIRFRTVYIFLTAITIALTALFEVAYLDEGMPLELILVQRSAILFLTFYFILQLFDFKPGFFTETAPEPKEVPTPSSVDHELVEQVLHLIEEEKYYRTEGLTIRQLAEKMEVKEYRLRQTINLHLGFRNFNDFLNAYRIKEAGDLLLAPERKDQTVLEIAYEMGFRSLAPFNKAFKNIKGMTPTEWRRRNG